MLKKAVKITETNKTYLGDRYLVTEEMMEGAVGLYLIADFGETTQHSFISQAGLDAFYTPTGKKLENDFVEYELTVVVL